MKTFHAILFLLLAGCAVRKPEAGSQKSDLGPRTSDLIAMDSRAQPELVLPPPSVTLIPDREDTGSITVVYPPSFDASQFEWHAEVSPDLKRWFYFYQFEDSPTIYFPRFKPATFIRLVGEPLTQ